MVGKTYFAAKGMGLSPCVQLSIRVGMLTVSTSLSWAWLRPTCNRHLHESIQGERLEANLLSTLPAHLSFHPLTLPPTHSSTYHPSLHPSIHIHPFSIHHPSIAKHPGKALC